MHFFYPPYAAAFFIGRLTPLQACIDFSTQAAVGVIVLYLLNLIVVPAVLSLDFRVRRANNLCCIPCVVLSPSTGTSRGDGDVDDGSASAAILGGGSDDPTDAVIVIVDAESVEEEEENENEKTNEEEGEEEEEEDGDDASTKKKKKKKKKKKNVAASAGPVGNGAETRDVSFWARAGGGEASGESADADDTDEVLPPTQARKSGESTADLLPPTLSSISLHAEESEDPPPPSISSAEDDLLPPPPLTVFMCVRKHATCSYCGKDEHASPRTSEVHDENNDAQRLSPKEKATRAVESRRGPVTSLFVAKVYVHFFWRAYVLV